MYLHRDDVVFMETPMHCAPHFTFIPLSPGSPGVPGNPGGPIGP